MSVKALLFDIDDTLYNHKEWLAGAFLEVGKLMRLEFGVKKEVVRDKLILLTEKYTSAAGNLFNLLLHELGVRESPLLIKRMINAFYSHRPARLTPYPGAKKLLRRLRAKGLKLGIVSDGKESVQIQKLKALGLLNYFDAVVISDKHGREYRKPSPLPYENALRKLGVTAKEAVYVGDNPYKDFIGAKKIGIRTIRVLLGEYKDVKESWWREADFVVNDVLGILDVLEKFSTPSSLLGTSLP